MNITLIQSVISILEKFLVTDSKGYSIFLPGKRTKVIGSAQGSTECFNSVCRSCSQHRATGHDVEAMKLSNNTVCSVRIAAEVFCISAAQACIKSCVHIIIDQYAAVLLWHIIHVHLDH